MSNEVNFETYLFISKKKFIIRVIHNSSFEKIYSEQILLDDNSELDFEILNEFLEKNIFKLEKFLKNFIKNIYIIINKKEFFPVRISLKKNNNGNLINSTSLIYPLNNLKNSFKSNYNDKKIIHILIE